jgi:hypothetical protein
MFRRRVVCVVAVVLLAVFFVWHFCLPQGVTAVDLWHRFREWLAYDLGISV